MILQRLGVCVFMRAGASSSRSTSCRRQGCHPRPWRSPRRGSCPLPSLRTPPPPSRNNAHTKKKKNGSSTPQNTCPKKNKTGAIEKRWGAGGEIVVVRHEGAKSRCVQQCSVYLHTRTSRHHTRAVRHHASIHKSHEKCSYSCFIHSDISTRCSYCTSAFL